MVAASGKSSARACPGGGASSGRSTPALLRFVGREPGVAARAGEDGDASPAWARPRLSHRPGKLEQLVRVGGPGAPGLLDQRAKDPLVTGERAGVCRGGPGAGRRRTDLKHRNPGLALRAFGQSTGELGAVPIGLEEHGNRSDAVRLREGRQPIARVEHRLVAGRDERVEADPAARADRVDRDVAALRDHRHAAGLEDRYRVAPQRCAGADGDHAVAVRAADGEADVERLRAQLGLELAAGIDLTEARGEHDRAAATPRGDLPDQWRHAGGRNRDHDRVHGLRQIGDGRHARMPVDLGPLGVDPVDRSRESGPGEVGVDGVGVGARAGRWRRRRRPSVAAAMASDRWRVQ